MTRHAHQTASSLPLFEAEQAAEAAREAAAIGGRVDYDDRDPAHRALIEAGEGVAEGFELAEEELVAAAEDTDGFRRPLSDAFTPERIGGRSAGKYGEADHEQSSEIPRNDR